MKPFAVLFFACALSGCEFIKTVAPQTTAGFEANGILGALDGASGAVLARCRTASGMEVRVAVDGLAEIAGSGDLLARVRGARIKACATAKGINAIVNAGGGDSPVISPLGTGAPEKPEG